MSVVGGGWFSFGLLITLIKFTATTTTTTTTTTAANHNMVRTTALGCIFSSATTRVPETTGRGKVSSGICRSRFVVPRLVRAGCWRA
jgi:hypothetical protein